MMAGVMSSIVFVNNHFCLLSHSIVHCHCCVDPMEAASRSFVCKVVESKCLQMFDALIDDLVGLRLCDSGTYFEVMLWFGWFGGRLDLKSDIHFYRNICGLRVMEYIE